MAFDQALQTLAQKALAFVAHMKAFLNLVLASDIQRRDLMESLRTLNSDFQSCLARPLQNSNSCKLDNLQTPYNDNLHPVDAAKARLGQLWLQTLIPLIDVVPLKTRAQDPNANPYLSNEGLKEITYSGLADLIDFKIFDWTNTVDFGMRAPHLTVSPFLDGAALTPILRPFLGYHVAGWGMLSSFTLPSLSFGFQFQSTPTLAAIGLGLFFPPALAALTQHGWVNVEVTVVELPFVIYADQDLAGLQPTTVKSVVDSIQHGPINVSTTVLALFPQLAALESAFVDIVSGPVLSAWSDKLTKLLQNGLNSFLSPIPYFNLSSIMHLGAPPLLGLTQQT